VRGSCARSIVYLYTVRIRPCVRFYVCTARAVPACVTSAHLPVLHVMFVGRIHDHLKCTQDIHLDKLLVHGTNLDVFLYKPLERCRAPLLVLGIVLVGHTSPLLSPGCTQSNGANIECIYMPHLSLWVYVVHHNAVRSTRDRIAIILSSLT
jgi:hypothetical protein